MKARLLLMTVVILTTSTILGCVVPGGTAPEIAAPTMMAIPTQTPPPAPQPTHVPETCDIQYPKAAIPLADRHRLLTRLALSDLENLNFEAIKVDVKDFEALIIEVEDLETPLLYEQYHRLWLTSLRSFNESLKAVVKGEAQIASDKFAEASQAAEGMVDELDRIDEFCRNKGQDA